MVVLMLRPSVEKDLKILGRDRRQMLIQSCREIFENPSIGKPLTRNLCGFFVYRADVYRIVYKRYHNSSVDIIAIGHRRDIYERVKR